MHHLEPAFDTTLRNPSTGKSMRQSLASSLAPVLAATAVALGAALAPIAAQAAIVQQGFTLAADFGPVAGPLAGSFSYDDAVTPTASPFGDRLVPLSSFTLDLGATSLGLGDAQEAFAAFNQDGFIGLVVTVDGVLTLSPSVGSNSPFFALSTRAGESMGTVRFADPQVRISEPAGLALAALGLAALSLRRRRP